MLNRAILIGRLTRDPELRYTQNGIAVAQFTLACDRPFTNQDGEKEADFIPIVAWRQLGENCANYLRKGRLCAVEGRIQVRHFDNDEGRRVYVTEIVADNVRFLESAKNHENNDSPAEPRSSGTSGSRGSNRSAPAPSHSDPFDDGKPIDISVDDLPF